MTRRRLATDEGVTLIEMVIAMLIMSIAVVTIVGALTTMIQLTAEHRGHAVIEAGTRNFGEAAQQQAQFTTKLTAATTATATTLTVADTSLLPRVDGNETYISVDREVMRVTGISGSGTSLSVDRNINADATTHDLGATVVTVLRCPTGAQLTPMAGTYESVTGVVSTLDSVEYWNPTTSTFEGRTACLANFDDNCTAAGLAVGFECGYGLFRAAITLTTPGDSRLRNVTTSTKILLRAGSS